MIHSIRWKLFSVFVLLLMVFLSIFFVMNSFFLDDIFISGDKARMNQIYTLFKEGMEKGVDTEERIYQLAKEFGGDISLVNSDKKVMASSSSHRVRFRLSPIPPHMRVLMNEIENSEKDTYFKVLTEENQLKSMVFVGKLPYNNALFIEKPLQVVYESSRLAERFIIISGIGTLILGSILMYFLSIKLTKPIIRLNNVALEIANLNFNEKLEDLSEDEIGTLGRSINLISDKLSCSLGELQEANSKLQEDIERERKMEKMRRRFVSSVSHELKTPISMIQGYADGLKFNIAKTPEDRKYYCDVISEESQKMSRLIKDLLDLSSYESGTFKIIKSEFDISTLIEDTVEKYHSSLMNNHIHLELDILEHCTIIADQLRIEQVLNNFINNAVRHVDEYGRIKIHLSRNDDKIFLSIFNSGKNIDEKECARIWTSFYKAESNVSSTNSGTGLGLAIVRAIVELHQGEYGIENINGGVKFWVELPSPLSST